jgi:dTDP-4-amino-4,6-dideoxygalactose transaminase
MVRTDEGIVFEAPGLNYRLTELQGALGIGQMDQLDAILATRRRLGHAYLEAIDRDLPFLGVPAGLRDPGNTFQSFTVRVPSEQRAAWMQRLRDAGVETTIGTYAVTSQPWYARSQGIRASDFPEAVRAQRELMTLPLHHGMSLDDVATVVDALRALPDSPAPEPNA